MARVKIPILPTLDENTQRALRAIEQEFERLYAELDKLKKRVEELEGP